VLGVFSSKTPLVKELLGDVTKANHCGDCEKFSKYLLLEPWQKTKKIHNPYTKCVPNSVRDEMPTQDIYTQNQVKESMY
jgi:hypothetical protein